MGRIRHGFREAVLLLRIAIRNWQQDKAPRMGAALAYYIALSLAPVVSVLLAIAGRVVAGGQTAMSEFVPQIRSLVGYEGTHAVRAMVAQYRHSHGGLGATILGLATVLVAASAVVGELRDAMNTIWKVPAKPEPDDAGGMAQQAKEWMYSLALVVACGLLLVASLILDAWVFAAGKFLNASDWMPGKFVETGDSAISFAVVAALFAFVFKVLPRVRLRWSDVAGGAVGTALLFVAGKVLLGFYLGKAGIGNAYGAAGSLVVVLVWVYYSAQVLFLGAEFTRAYAERFGSMAAKGHSHAILV